MVETRVGLNLALYSKLVDGLVFFFCLVKKRIAGSAFSLWSLGYLGHHYGSYNTMMVWLGLLSLYLLFFALRTLRNNPKSKPDGSVSLQEPV